MLATLNQRGDDGPRRIGGDALGQISSPRGQRVRAPKNSRCPTVSRGGACRRQAEAVRTVSLQAFPATPARAGRGWAAGLERPFKDFSERGLLAFRDCEVLTEAIARVFVVDDISVREALETLILSVGWHAETFASAQESLARPSAAAPGCLVLDVSLPDVSGLELQKRVAHDGAGLPIVFIMGHEDIPTTV